MVTPQKLPGRKSDSPKARAAVARQQLLLINGLLDEVARNYLARLHRETAELIRAIERKPTGESGARQQEKNLRKILKLIGHLHIDPEKGRRKDLKKIDALIGKLQAIVEL